MPIFTNIGKLFRFFIEQLENIFVIIDGNIINWFWLRPNITIQIAIVAYNFKNWKAWTTLLVVFLGENILHFIAISLYNYRLWSESIIAGYFLANPDSQYKKIDFSIPPLELVWLIRQIFLPLTVSIIGVKSSRLNSKLKTYQIASGATIVFVPTEYASDVLDATDKGALEEVDVSRRNLSKCLKLFDIYHEIGHASVVHNHFGRQSEFSTFYFAAFVVSLSLQSHGSLLTLILATAIFGVYIIWVSREKFPIFRYKLVSQLLFQNREVFRYEVLADFYALFCLLNILKSKLGNNNDAAREKFRIATARFIKLWRRTKHLRCRYTRYLARFAQILSKDHDSSKTAGLMFTGILFGLSADLRPPLILRMFFFVVILLLASYVSIPSAIDLLTLIFFWLVLPALVYVYLAFRTTGLQGQAYTYLVRNGYDGTFSDIA